MNTLKWLAQNKLMENRHVFIKFWSKKWSVEKAQADQNATENVVTKLKRAH